MGVVECRSDDLWEGTFEDRVAGVIAEMHGHDGVHIESKQLGAPWCQDACGGWGDQEGAM